MYLEGGKRQRDRQGDGVGEEERKRGKEGFQREGKIERERANF